jgi:vacuolar protein sorting-associated protein 45
MCHEIIEIKNNMCTVETDGSSNVFALEEDSFYSSNMYADYGFFCESIGKFVEDLNKEKKELTKSTDVDELRKSIQVIPEITKKTEIMNKHMTIISKLLSVVTSRDLLRISKIEQTCIRDGDIEEDYKSICELIADKDINLRDILRVVLIYVLRHENKKSAKIEEIKSILVARGMKLDEVRLIDTILYYCGNKSKKLDLFSSHLFREKITSMFDSKESAVNLLTQNKPLVLEILEQVAKNKLPELKYPVRKLNHSTLKITDYSKVVVFVIGGCTYEEVAKIQINKTNLPFEVVIGGTTILNSNQFINNFFTNG